MAKANSNLLRVRRPNGQYRAAKPREIYEAASALYRERLLNKRTALTSPFATADYLQMTIGHLEHEVFCCLYLDNRNRVIAAEPLFNGTVDGTSVYPREVVKRALAHNAAAVIFAHNHPSGVAEPSGADESITRRLMDALALVDIRVLDHMVIGEEVVSLAERGMI